MIGKQISVRKYYEDRKWVNGDTWVHCNILDKVRANIGNTLKDYYLCLTGHHSSVIFVDPVDIVSAHLNH